MCIGGACLSWPPQGCWWVLLAFLWGGSAVAAPCATADIALHHVVVLVEDLTHSRRELQEAGFAVQAEYRGTHGYTDHVAVEFPGGAVLEMVAPNQSLRTLQMMGFLRPMIATQTPLAQRFLGHIVAERGVADFALAVSDLDDVVRALAAQNVFYAAPEEAQIYRGGGIYQMAQVAVPHEAYLPMLVEREAQSVGAPRHYPQQSPHDIAALQVAVADLAAAEAAYRTLLCLSPHAGGQERAMMPAALQLPLDRYTLQLVQVSAQPAPDGSFQTPSQGLYRVHLQASSGLAEAALAQQRQRVAAVLPGVELGPLSDVVTGPGVVASRAQTWEVQLYGGLGVAHDLSAQPVTGGSWHAGARVMYRLTPTAAFGVDVELLNMYDFATDKAADRRLAMGLCWQQQLHRQWRLGFGPFVYLPMLEQAGAEVGGVATSLAYQPALRGPLQPYISLRHELLFTAPVSQYVAVSGGLGLRW